MSAPITTNVAINVTTVSFESVFVSVVFAFSRFVLAVMVSFTGSYDHGGDGIVNRLRIKWSFLLYAVHNWSLQRQSEFFEKDLWFSKLWTRRTPQGLKIIWFRKTNVNLLFPQYPDISDGYNYNYQDKETSKANLKTTKRWDNFLILKLIYFSICLYIFPYGYG